MNLANATDLERWAELREAQGVLPQLVRRLVSATANGLIRLSARAGEGVALPGWDGLVEAREADAHIPAGTSAWEMGVTADVAAKANQDYRKRTDDPGSVNPAESTFVFVTPRRWRGKDDWTRARIAEGVWKHVIVYDADDLETWMERAPHVHAWISAAVGKDPYEIESLGTWWQKWSAATNPPLAPELVLSGRDEESTAVRNTVSSAPSSLTVSADSHDEATAFIAAALQVASRDDSSLVVQRALIVRTPAAWRRVAVTDRPLILLPLFDNPEVTLAVGRGHTALIPLGREVEASSGIDLPRLRRDGIESALKVLGLSDDRAAALSTVGRRSLQSLRRALAVHRELHTPLWARPEHARDILPAVLAGRWSDRVEGDRAALSELAGRPYEEIVAVLTRWANSSDPPVRRVGDVWIVTAKDDALSLLARNATAQDLDRFTRVAERVIGSEEPTIGLGQDERLIAPLLGKRREYSGHLIEGLADTLALLGASSDRIRLPGNVQGQHIVDRVVRAVLGSANEDATGRRWISIAASLPLLAEAAPSAFLDAAERAASGDQPVLLKLFQDREGFDPFFGGSAHPSLLWAVEELAWSIQYLARSALLLATLSRLDPGGNYTNRPSGSLRGVLWGAGTSATFEQRLQVMELIRRREPEVAWNLILTLLPPGRNHAANTHAPVWRNWKPEDAHVHVSEFTRVVRVLGEMAIDDVGTDGQRWVSLLARIADLPDDLRSRLIAKLTDHAAHFSEADRAIIVSECSRLIGTHRKFAEADRALSAADVDKLEEAVERLQPDSPLLKHAWLFTPGALPRSPRTDLETRRDELDRAQREAIMECVSACGIEPVLDWAEESKTNGYSQRAIGWALAVAGIEGTETEKVLLNTLVSGSAARRLVASAFVSVVARSHGEQFAGWAASIIDQKGNTWGPAHKAAFLAALQAHEDVWALVESLGLEVEHAYWTMMGPYGLPMDGPAREQAARKLIEHKRPYVAVQVLDAHEETLPDPPLELIAAALENALQTQPDSPLDNMFSYHVDRHLTRLEQGGFDEQRLARLEWAYLPLFRYENREMRVLHRALSEDPAFFVEVVTIIYRAEGEEPRELTKEELERAHTARDLLASWRRIPGSSDDGTIDPEALSAWVDTVRQQLRDRGRLRIGDHHIGQVLRYGPAPREQQWPAEPICDLIERIASADLEGGITMEVYNSRGVTMREQTEGGEQERQLAARYREYANAASLRWPRTAALLNVIAESYEDDARRHDTDAAITEDLWR